MSTRSVGITLLALGISAAALPDVAGAIQLFDPASFGTGVYSGPPPGGQFSLQGTTAFQTLSTEDAFNGTVTGEARASANASLQGFHIGAAISANSSDFYPSAFMSGGARAYTGLTVSTDTPIQLSGYFTLDGSFLAQANDSASVLFAVLDINGSELAEVDLDAHSTGLLVACNPPGSCTSRTVLPSATTFSLTVPFVLPTLVSTGIYGVLDSFAEDGTVDGQIVSADFLTTATLTFTPPPGVTVTLATGQTFVGAPEPDSLALTGIALLGLVAWRRRVH